MHPERADKRRSLKLEYTNALDSPRNDDIIAYTLEILVSA